MCYSVSNEVFDIEITSQPIQSSFHSKNKNDSCAIENKDFNLIDNKQKSLVELEKNVLSSQLSSKTNKSNCQSSLYELTNNEVTFSKKQQNKEKPSKWTQLQNDTKQSKVEEDKKNAEVQDNDFSTIKKESTEYIDLNLIKSETKTDECQKLFIESERNGSELSGHLTNCHKSRSTFNEYFIDNSNQRCKNSCSIKTVRVHENLDAAIPSESAAVEPQEMAYVPEMLSENINLNSTFTSPQKNVNTENSSDLSKDTATILQELALQRLSGGDKVELTPTRRKYDCDITRDRRSFDSEIGREILRERKMKQELESAREKVDESILAGHNKP